MGTLAAATKLESNFLIIEKIPKLPSAQPIGPIPVYAVPPSCGCYVRPFGRQLELIRGGPLVEGSEQCFAIASGWACLSVDCEDIWILFLILIASSSEKNNEWAG